MQLVHFASILSGDLRIWVLFLLWLQVVRHRLFVLLFQLLMSLFFVIYLLDESDSSFDLLDVHFSSLPNNKMSRSTFLLQVCWLYYALLEFQILLFLYLWALCTSSLQLFALTVSLLMGFGYLPWTSRRELTDCFNNSKISKLKRCELLFKVPEWVCFLLLESEISHSCSLGSRGREGCPW